MRSVRIEPPKIYPLLTTNRAGMENLVSAKPYACQRSPSQIQHGEVGYRTACNDVECKWGEVQNAAHLTICVSMHTR